MAAITSKREFYTLYNRGLLGNRLRNWTLRDWAAFGNHYPVAIVAARNTVRPGAPMRYDLRACDALNWVTAQPDALDYHFAELAPDHENTLQGEVMRDERYLYLRYVLNKHQRMRVAFAGPTQHAYGLKAQTLLKEYMDASSYDFVQSAFDQYPDSVIEFCCYSRAVGLLDWNCLFWEVRDY